MFLRAANRPFARRWQLRIDRRMKALEGDIVDVHASSGVAQIEVLEIRYGGARGETDQISPRRC
jgi:hypothetical protein